MIKRKVGDRKLYLWMLYKPENKSKICLHRLDQWVMIADNEQCFITDGEHEIMRYLISQGIPDEVVFFNLKKLRI